VVLLMERATVFAFGRVAVLFLGRIEGDFFSDCESEGFDAEEGEVEG